MHCFTWTILVGLLAIASAAGGGGGGAQRQSSSGYQEQDTARAFYSYGYRDDSAARAEYSSRDGTSRGFYSYVDADGKLQTVRYEANGLEGFKAEASNQPQAPVDEGKAPLPVTDTEEVQQARLAHMNALRDAREEALAASLREEAAARRQQEQARSKSNEDQQSGEQSLTDEDAAILERVRAELAAMLAERQRASSLPRNREEEEQDQREPRLELRDEQRQAEDQIDLRQELRDERRQDQDQRELRDEQRQEQRSQQRLEQRPRQDQRQSQRQDLHQDRRQNQRPDQSRNQESLRDSTNSRENDRQIDRQSSQISADRDTDDLRLRTIYSLADLNSRSYLKLGDLTTADKLLEDRLDNTDLRVPVGAYYTLVSPNTKYSVTTPTELRTLRPVALSRSLLVSKRN